MKKIMLLIGISILCLTGCNTETKTMVCTRTANQSGIVLNLRYEAEYKKNIVSKVKTTEKVKSDSTDTLISYKEAIEKVYEPYKNIEYYQYSVIIEGDTLISSTDIDYSKINTDKLLEVDSANGQLIKDGKIKISSL